MRSANCGDNRVHAIREQQGQQQPVNELDRIPGAFQKRWNRIVSELKLNPHEDISRRLVRNLATFTLCTETFGELCKALGEFSKYQEDELTDFKASRDRLDRLSNEEHEITSRIVDRELRERLLEQARILVPLMSAWELSACYHGRLESMVVRASAMMAIRVLRTTLEEDDLSLVFTTILDFGKSFIQYIPVVGQYSIVAELVEKAQALTQTRSERVKTSSDYLYDLDSRSDGHELCAICMQMSTDLIRHQVQLGVALGEPERLDQAPDALQHSVARVNARYESILRKYLCA